MAARRKVERKYLVGDWEIGQFSRLKSQKNARQQNIKMGTETSKAESVTNGAEFSKTQQDKEKPRKKISNNDNNLRRDNRLNNPSDPNISNKQTKNPDEEFEPKSQTTKPEDIAERK
ncbi:Hypothetical predicted protein [Mytilus galloprovincialis]|uniref:Uncharacterized protein n=1 Tax=Mytilus galloprovincialis TaxID=29158 RepID=A0A8B6HDH9_MYTGA|nr:Hypothetical predicted protein [Mytilus galloprovincialis]